MKIGPTIGSTVDSVSPSIHFSPLNAEVISTVLYSVQLRMFCVPLKNFQVPSSKR